MKGFDTFREKLDGILDDYHYMKGRHEVLEKMSTVYSEMRDLLDEMKQMGELDRYNVEGIFNGIEEIDKMGL
ncbi:hypothetical protein [Bacillus paranthracis]|uniref:hypothetical protein n=1 Tax=Bacillus paranthracis TaxID=2026186 RepID=UPI002D7A029F|nr:hypothetical protein [Bacillus paranthracis]